nr:MAG TPA: hypothetical protein [Caudoviricetes sp.]
MICDIDSLAARYSGLVSRWYDWLYGFEFACL